MKGYVTIGELRRVWFPHCGEIEREVRATLRNWHGELVDRQELAEQLIPRLVMLIIYRREETRRAAAEPLPPSKGRTLEHVRR
jgi:hypothetical protein